MYDHYYVVKSYDMPGWLSLVERRTHREIPIFWNLMFGIKWMLPGYPEVAGSNPAPGIIFDFIIIVHLGFEPLSLEFLYLTTDPNWNSNPAATNPAVPNYWKNSAISMIHLRNFYDTVTNPGVKISS